MAKPTAKGARPTAREARRARVRVWQKRVDALLEREEKERRFTGKKEMKRMGVAGERLRDHGFSKHSFQARAHRALRQKAAAAGRWATVNERTETNRSFGEGRPWR